MLYYCYTMAKQYDGMKYGYICMTCGSTIPYGVNKDGECKICAGNYSRIVANKLAYKIRQNQARRNDFVNIDDDMLIAKLKKMAGF